MGCRPIAWLCSDENVGRSKWTNERVSFAGEDLRHAAMDDGFFFLLDFEGANLQSASLRRAHFVGRNLRDVDFRWANLTDAEFSSSPNARDHELTHGLCDLTGAKWEGAILKNVTFDGVVSQPDND
jgi:uncharacterized protein YjbI with pentapeptide repeats